MNEPNTLSERPPSPEIPAAFEASRPSFYIERVPPTFTRIILVINILVFLAMTIYGYAEYGTWRGTETTTVLVQFGAKVTPLVLQGEYWRLLAAMFIHIGIMHLLFNSYALFALGPMVEGYYGHWRFLAIYLIGGLFGSLASYGFTPAISAGASGAIFALAGAILVYFLKYKENFGAQGRAILRNMLFVIAINLVFGMSMSGIDNWGHIGGLVGGMLLGWGLLPRYKAPTVVRMGRQPLAQEQRVTRDLIWVTAAFGLLLLGVQLAERFLIPNLLG